MFYPRPISASLSGPMELRGGYYLAIGPYGPGIRSGTHRFGEYAHAFLCAPPYFLAISPDSSVTPSRLTTWCSLGLAVARSPYLPFSLNFCDIFLSLLAAALAIDDKAEKRLERNCIRATANTQRQMCNTSRTDWEGKGARQHRPIDGATRSSHPPHPKPAQPFAIRPMASQPRRRTCWGAGVTTGESGGFRTTKVGY